jgi:prolipoprotein diacylglyceryltransferase
MGLIEGWDPIKIGIDPEIAHWGGLLLTWHGVFVAIGIALGVWVAVKMAARAGFIEDDSYTIALVGVATGIVGARVLFVAENHSLFEGRLLDIFRINEGGISIYGALIGGVLGAILYNNVHVGATPKGSSCPPGGARLCSGRRTDATAKGSWRPAPADPGRP